MTSATTAPSSSTSGLRKAVGECANCAKDIEDLDIAAELEYHADPLALLDRTRPSEVDILVSKDRSEAAPRRLTVTW